MDIEGRSSEREEMSEDKEEKVLKERGNGVVGERRAQK